MRKIGLMSDTHSDLCMEEFMKYFGDCDEIWHAGDVGDLEIVKKIKEKKEFKGVFGNIDDMYVRNVLPEHLRFKCEDVDVWITHVGGYPGKYHYPIKEELKSNPPNLFICGHSHILKVMHDDELNLLYINPGASGRTGQHTIRTWVRFIIDGSNIKDLEVIELGHR